MMPKHEPTRAALYELLNALGYEAAASVLYVEKPGAVMSIACGSEEAIERLQDAMDSGVSVVLIERPSKDTHGSRN
jgi:hypothetical protein